MVKNLLIVESPAKANTIKKYLGKDFIIMASVGHLKDLPKNRFGVDIDNDFQPEYVTIKGKGKVLKALKEAGKKSDTVYLGPDPDREGEAIAWHISEELRDTGAKTWRVLFNELTAGAIREAVAAPQKLDKNKYESQQARRVLDRLVGYKISPLLWTRVKRGLSAGRVQSVAVKMICDREREIQAFEPEEYWSLTAHLKSTDPPEFQARFVKWDDEKLELKNEEQTQKIISHVKDRVFEVASVSKKKKKKNPLPPFITSLLQQEASRRLGFSAKKTMSVAQNLYEGVELGDKGQVGLITYMRTDSFRISKDAVSEAREFIRHSFGSDYLPEKAHYFKSPKGAQEAHEAIRPTSVGFEPEKIARYLTKDQNALYSLIWKRFVASQMSPAVLNQTRVEITAGRAGFRASGSVVVFKGYTVLYQESAESESSDKDKRLPALKKGQTLEPVKLEPAQHFTKPPPRYSEATLIKALEENGIGRPSTYATILSNISNKEYVSVEKKRFKPTELGFLVTDLLVESFPDIMDTDFTAQMESRLDKIERGREKWTRVLADFYSSFRKELEKAEREMKGEVETGLTCPDCGRPLAVKSGRNGVFLACSGYPECRYTSDFSRDEKGRIVLKEGPEVGKEKGTCRLCGRKMVVKKGRYGPFLACSGYPECTYTLSLGEEGEIIEDSEPAGVDCKVCGSRMLVKKGRAGQKFLACENYPKCTHTESVSTGIPCPEEGCQGTLVEKVSKKGRHFYACSSYPNCRFAMWDEPYDGACPECGTKVLAVKRPKKSPPVVACRKKECGFKRSLDDASND